MLNKALYTYYIAKDAQELPEELTQRHSFGDYMIATSEATGCYVANGEKSNVAVIGFAVDALKEIPVNQGIAEYLANSAKNIHELLQQEVRLAGKYVIIFRGENGQVFAIGDATGCIQVNYSAAGGAACAIAALMARQKKIPFSEKLLKLRHSSFDCSQPMPWNVTLYDEIKALLPNHYVCLDTGETVRFPAYGRIFTHTAKEMIENIAQQYAQHFQIVCPLTGGKDSRVVFAFLKQILPDLRCYTMQHKHMADDHVDLVLPRRICEQQKHEHRIIPDVSGDPKWVQAFDELYGKGVYSTNTLILAQTILSQFEGCTIISGEIVGHIGKAGLQRGIPNCLMKPHFLQCMDKSTASAAYQKKWYKDALAEERVQINELYSWEIRLGRWAPQGIQIYDLMGLNNINIFNNRAIISEWLDIPRRVRIKAVVHKSLLQQLEPDLLKIPYNDHKLTIHKLLKSNGVTYYLSLYTKYYVRRLLLWCRKK